MIVEPNITELNQYADCRYSLVVATARRARQIVAGAEPLIDTSETKPVSIAVREIDAERIYIRPREEE
jgi:DNA-directed RNA polymerase subunit omega